MTGLTVYLTVLAALIGTATALTLLLAWIVSAGRPAGAPRGVRPDRHTRPRPVPSLLRAGAHTKETTDA